MTAAAREGALALGIAHIQHMALRQFHGEEVPKAACNKTQEMTILRTEADHRAGLAFEALTSISGYGSALTRMVTEIRRSCAGLNATRMMCKAEAARHGGDKVSFDAIIARLDQFQSDVEACAQDMVTHSQALGTMIARTKHEAQKQTRARRQRTARGSTPTLQPKVETL